MHFVAVGSCVRDRSSGASDGSLTARLATHGTFVSSDPIGLEADRHVSLLADTQGCYQAAYWTGQRLLIEEWRNLSTGVT